MTRLDAKIIEITEFGPLIETADGSLTIRHSIHGQDFHSEEGARFEAWNLYVLTSGFGTALQAHSKQDIMILDVGMGLGYNAAATIAAWLEGPGLMNIDMLSLEIDPRLAQVAASGCAPWQAGWPDSWLFGLKSLHSCVDGFKAEISHPLSDKILKWRISLGDASQKDFTGFECKINYVWQDPFTPELNPTMWSSKWFEKLKGLARPECVLVSYSVARVVKQALEDAGWRYERVATPGRKRHWLKASL